MKDASFEKIREDNQEWAVVSSYEEFHVEASAVIVGCKSGKTCTIRGSCLGPRFMRFPK